MFFSLNGWLHDLSDYYLFSAHMVQHLLLALAVAPLLIIGHPGLDAAAGAPAGAASGPSRAGSPRRRAASRSSTSSSSRWHLPPLYNYAMAHHGVHIVQHLMLLVGVGADVVAGPEPAARAAAAVAIRGRCSTCS